MVRIIAQNVILHKCEIGLNQCDECNENGELCKKCLEGYFPDENGGCSYSDNCEISYNGKCLKCKEGYILIGEEVIKICKSLNFGDLKNCEEINKTTGFCQKCKEGYYLNNGDRKCTHTEHCYKSVYDVGIKCNNNYYVDKKDINVKIKVEHLYFVKSLLMVKFAIYVMIIIILMKMENV